MLLRSFALISRAFAAQDQNLKRLKFHQELDMLISERDAPITSPGPNATRTCYKLERPFDSPNLQQFTHPRLRQPGFEGTFCS